MGRSAIGIAPCSSRGPERRLLLLYPFRSVDPVTGRWVRARYKAERRELVQRYAQWEIIGAPEIGRVGVGTSDTFNPFR